MSTTSIFFLTPNSNTLYLHSNFITNPNTILYSKPFNSKLATFSSKSSNHNNPTKNVQKCNLEFENQPGMIPQVESPEDEVYTDLTPPTSSELERLFPIDPRSSSVIKGPTAPWMKGPLLVEPNQVLDLSKSRKKKDSNFAKSQVPSDELSGKVSGGRGKKAMKMIYQGIDKLQENQSWDFTNVESDVKVEFQFPPGSLAQWRNVKGSTTHEASRVQAGSREGSHLKGRDEKVELDILSRESEGRGNRNMPWEREERIVYRRMRKEKVLTAAESNLDVMLLERLRSEAARIEKWVKVKKAGVTPAVIDQIHLIWKNNELVMLKFDLPLCRNMDRAREITEMKSGGLVVWSKKNALVVYRGCDYTFRWKDHPELRHDFLYSQQSASSSESFKERSAVSPLNSSASSVDEMMSGENSEEDSLAVNGSLYEREGNRLLDDLGPRYVDWWWPKPLPVDADQLPEVVPGFMPPFRLCAPRSSSKLTDDELTHFRKLAHSLPTHFVLGRNRKLQGLAAAIVKLWEKCHIAKIALKWGIPNTNNELMANELKYLTGGVLILRNKFFIILYRGKDFLPPQVASLVAEREVDLTRCQLEEEAARSKAIEILPITTKESMSSSSIGTLSEFQTIAEITEPGKEKSEIEVQLVAEKERLEKELRNQQHSLYILNKKIEKSSIELGKLNASWKPAEQDGDKEILTQEERHSLRQIGLKMDRSLVLGRRGVFDGVVAGLHQHWKHREVVKVITMQKILSQIMHTAKLLETESGGILVSVDKLKEGHAILIYRGKNYRRPELVPQNLLNKRQALHRSLEMQRLGSLKFYANQMEQAISDLKCKLEEYKVEIGQMGEM